MLNYNNLPKLWKSKFDEYNNIDILLQNINKEYDNEIIYPEKNNIFKCFHYFDLNQTKIVILGQDPYYTPNMASGLAFGVNNNNKIPPSLKNISKELYNDLNIDLNDYTLETWAQQKILLLNTSLTVIKNKPSSHIKYWNDFINYILKQLNEMENIIFIGWGKHAHDKLKIINKNKHYILISSHPSPLSCNKYYGIYLPFNNSKPFSKINKILEYNNFSTINW
jgi:uracil-DNA glycosylase